MEQIGLHRSFASRGRNLNDDEYLGLSEFRKELKDFRQSLGVSGRKALQEQSDENSRYGVTEHDCAAWYLLLGGDTDRFRALISKNIKVTTFAAYWSYGIYDDAIILDSIVSDRTPEDALELFKNSPKLVKGDEMMYAYTA